ncbi:hypothetical protein Q1695_003579 [Nippostrongylus brasiliensis]|nr:hypothetical protein Q1695_003579 [Nippostrongylus brasiliensis]
MPQSSARRRCSSTTSEESTSGEGPSNLGVKLSGRHWIRTTGNPTHHDTEIAYSSAPTTIVRSLLSRIFETSSAATDEEKEEFYELPERIVNDEKSNYKVVAGDFNATVGTNDCDEWRLGQHGSSSRNDNGMRLIDFQWSLFDVSLLPPFDTGSDHRLFRAKLTLRKKIFKRDTHKPAPLRVPSFSSQELEHAIDSYDWKCLEDPSEDYDLLVSGLLRCASSSCRTSSSLASRLDARAMEPLEQRRAVKLDPNASHLERVTISKACRLAVKESIQAYRRLKLLEAAQKGSSIKRCKRDICDQKAVMSALMDKDGVTQTSRRAIETVVQDFYMDLFRSSIPVAKCVMTPAEEAF